MSRYGLSDSPTGQETPDGTPQLHLFVVHLDSVSDVRAEVDLSEAFVQQLAAPLLARATRDQAEQAAEDARAEAAEQIAALKYQMKEQQVGARESDTELRAEIASMASQLKKAHAEEIKLRQEHRELQKQQDNWEVQRERERDSLARTERKRAQQHAKESWPRLPRARTTSSANT